MTVMKRKLCIIIENAMRTRKRWLHEHIGCIVLVVVRMAVAVHRMVAVVVHRVAVHMVAVVVVHRVAGHTVVAVAHMLAGFAEDTETVC